MPARWPVSVLIRVSVGTVDAGDEDVETEYMLMVVSADEVASREPSGENLRQVIPLAWALTILCRSLKRRTFGSGAGRGEYGRDSGLEASTDECVEADRGVESLESPRRDRRLRRRRGLLSRQYVRLLSSSDSSG